MDAASGCDVAIVEIGGTVGDIESLPFLEAIRQLRIDLGSQNSVSVHVTLVPHIAAAGELKTKPTQHSVKELLGLGIQPEILICRVDQALPRSLKEKIAHFTNVPVDSVIAAKDVSVIYELPMALHSEGLDDRIVDRLNIWSRQPDLEIWRRAVERLKKPSNGAISVAVVGKYVDLKDSYKSLHEALVHGGLANDVHVHLHYVDSEELEQSDVHAELGVHHAILVPGGFGGRGSEGKVKAIRYAREQGIPFFGICLGMQMAIVEFARHCCGLSTANSVEFDPDTEHPVIHLMAEQHGVKDKGGTMRLGAYPCKLSSGSMARSIYGTDEISERHRHRFEVNNSYRDQLESAGLVLSGVSPDSKLVEMVELSDHPYFVGCQFHPEFKSKPHKAHPLFVRFIEAGMQNARQRSDALEAEAQAVVEESKGLVH